MYSVYQFPNVFQCIYSKVYRKTVRIAYAYQAELTEMPFLGYYFDFQEVGSFF